MAKYKIIITRDITESTVVTVEATSPDEAEFEAMTALLNAENTEWEIDDGSWDNDSPYVTDVTQEETD